MTGGNELGLAHYLRLLKHNLWLVLLVFVLVTASAVYYSERQPKQFQSSADVFLGTQNEAAALSNIAVQSSDPVRQAATQADLARTPAVAAQALRIAKITTRTPEGLLSNSSVSNPSNADILTFSVTDSDPLIAERLANGYATAYTRYRRQLDTTAIASARKQVERRLTQLSDAGEQRSAAYANLLTTEQQLATQQVLQGSNAMLVRSAGAAAQIAPRPKRDAALAAILGLVLGVGLAFGRDALNTRVRNASEVEERLHLPLLGRVPPPPRRLRAGDQLLMLADPRGVEAEAFRILATSLEFVNLERAARTIMFTSALRGEGKSTTVANLAVALARNGKRVVLVDLDLRQPSLMNFFSLGGRPGITDVALGHATLEDAVASVAVLSSTDEERAPSRNGRPPGGLAVLPSGPVPLNPAEFVGSPALAHILTSLEPSADLVLIDAPPMLGLSDAMSIAAGVDGVVVVTRQSVIRRGVLQELHRVLADAPVTKLGFVMTGSGEAESYGYGYGYGYGHGHAESSSSPSGARSST
jgi:polysaccharide biosynthesis transport protein